MAVCVKVLLQHLVLKVFVLKSRLTSACGRGCTFGEVFRVFLGEAAFDCDFEDDGEQSLVVLGLIAEDLEPALFEEEEGVCGANFLGLGVDAFYFRVDQLRHNYFAAWTIAYLLCE